MGVWPNALCICGAVLVMGSVVGIAIEEKYISDGNDNDDDDDESGSEYAADHTTISRMRSDSMTYP